MNYDQAKTIFQEVSPNLILDPDNGHTHIVVRKPGKRQPPFSITLPDASILTADHEPAEIAATERQQLLDAFDAAQRP